MTEPKSKKQTWKMPAWMEPYRELIGNTGGNSIEEMVVDDTSPTINLPRFVLATAVQSQVGLLCKLHERAMLAKLIKPAPPPAAKSKGG